MKRIFVASLGLAPQVVTETLWALLHPSASKEDTAPKPFVANIVHLISTGQVNPRMFSSVEERNQTIRDKISELFKQSKLPPPEIRIDPVLAAEDSSELQDIRSQQDNILYVNHVTKLLKAYADHPDTMIHMSLAGGRKTMSSYVHSAMMFFGRVQDEMSHVLVNPADLERAPDFWWPNQMNPPTVQVGDTDFPTSEPIASVDLVNVPFVHLNVRLPQDDLPEVIDHEMIVDFIEFERGDQPIVVDANTFSIRIGNDEVTLTPQMFAFFALCAIARVQAWPGVGPKEEGEGPNTAGWLRLRDFSHGIERDGKTIRRTRALAVLENLLARKSDGAQYRDGNLMDRILSVAIGETDPTMSDISKMETALREKIRSPFISKAVVPQKYKGSTGPNIGLNLPPNRILLIGFTDAELNTEYLAKE